MKKDSLYLRDLDSKELSNIINLPVVEFLHYIDLLIANYYPYTEKGSDKYVVLVDAYKASFYLEVFYRNSPIIVSNFTPIYTPTGLIREIVSDLYSIGPEKLVFQ